MLLSENNTSSRRLKHIATRIAYLRESVKDGQVQMHHITTNGNIAVCELWTGEAAGRRQEWTECLLAP